MKNLFAILTILFFAAISCNKAKKMHEGTSATTKINDSLPEKFAIDSVQIDDSLKITENVTAAFQSKLLVFPQIKDSILLDSIYSKTEIHPTNYSKAHLLKELQAKKSQFYQETKDGLQGWKPDFEQTWNNNSDMTIFSNKNDLLTIKYSGDGFTGGAHGYYYEFYKVFDLQTKKTLQLADVLSDKNPKIWSKILMDHFLKNDLENGQSEMLLVKEIPLNDNFYFDQDHLYFLYNQYEITAYAAGPVLIKVPFSAIQTILKSEFKKRLGL